MSEMLCKCCHQPARFCGDGPNRCDVELCANIVCDHCHMVYVLDNDAMNAQEDPHAARALMLLVYLGGTVCH